MNLETILTINAGVAIVVALVLMWAFLTRRNKSDQSGECPGCRTAFYQSIYLTGLQKCSYCGNIFEGQKTNHRKE